MKKSKLTTVLICLASAAILAGCGGKKEEASLADKLKKAEERAAEEKVAEEKESPKKEKPVKEKSAKDEEKPAAAHMLSFPMNLKQ